MNLKSEFCLYLETEGVVRLVSSFILINFTSTFISTVLNINILHILSGDAEGGVCGAEEISVGEVSEEISVASCDWEE